MDSRAFEEAANEIFAALPSRFIGSLQNVVIMVSDFPDEAVRREMQLETPYDLLGLYQGFPITERSISDSGLLPDLIHLYRLPILTFCEETGEQVMHCIRHVLVHEIGHYFGFSDEEMEAIEAGAKDLEKMNE